jgi:ornithine decarboxylase
VQGCAKRWEDIPTDELASDVRYWELVPGEKWHGFSHLKTGYVMTDPNKLTLLTPGFDRATGDYAAHGISAAVVAEFLREQRIVPEKNDLNSILFLLTPGLESSKAGTLLSALIRFKQLHDENAPLDEVIPTFVAAHARALCRRWPARLCAHRCMHSIASTNASQLQREQFRASIFPK